MFLDSIAAICYTLYIPKECIKGGETVARNKYPEITEARILDAAERLFLEKGYENTTIQDIVDALGDLTKGAVYHHFRSKEEIVDAVGERMFRQRNPFAAVADRTDLNGLEKFRESIRLNQRDEDRMEMTVQSMSILKNPRFLVEMIRDNQRDLAPYMQRFIEEGVRDGSIQTEYARELSEVIPLLTGLWMVPALYPATAEEMMHKFRFIGELLRRMGLPLVDDALLDQLGPYFQKIQDAQVEK